MINLSKSPVLLEAFGGGLRFSRVGEGQDRPAVIVGADQVQVSLSAVLCSSLTSAGLPTWLSTALRQD
jgi:hypothetical protein